MAAKTNRKHQPDPTNSLKEIKTSEPDDKVLLSIFQILSGNRVVKSEAERIAEYADNLLDPLIKKINTALLNIKKGSRLPQPLKPIVNYRDDKLKKKRIIEALSNHTDHDFIKDLFHDWLEFSNTKELFEDCTLFDFANSETLFSTSADKDRIQSVACDIWALGYFENSKWQKVLDALLISFQKVTDSSQTEQPKKHPSERLQKENKKLSTSNAGLTQQRNELDRKLKTSKKTIRDHKNDIEDLEKKLTNVTSENSKLENNLYKTDKKLNKLQTKQTRDTQTREKTEAKYKNELAAVRKDLGENKDLYQTTKKEKEEKESEIKELQDRPAGIKAGYKAITDKKEYLENLQYTQPKRREELKDQVDDLKNLQRLLKKSFPDELDNNHKNPTDNITEVIQSIAGNKKAGAVKFESLGGGNEIGASCYLLTVESTQVLIDAGIRMNKKLEEIGPDLTRWDNEDPSFSAVLITHAHADHAGWVPVLVKKWEGLDIYCTPQTKELLNVMFEDSLINLRRQLNEETIQNKYLSNPNKPPELPYNEEDIERALNAMIPVEYNENTQLPGQDNLEFTFIRAGHILGAASVLIESSTQKRRILISGDYSSDAQLTVSPSDWSKAVSETGEIDLLVTESTYGEKRKKNRVQFEDDLVEHISQVTKKNGTVLIPCFALGRAQEVISLINRAFIRKDLPRFKVFIDGLIDQINPIYENNQVLLINDEFENQFKYVRSQTDGYEHNEVINLSKKEPCVIVTTSGMMNGGPVIEYAKDLLPDSKNQLILCGYQDSESPGNKILNLGSSDSKDRKIRVPYQNDKNDRNRKNNGEIEIEVANPAVMISLSAHSDLKGMVDAIKSVNPRNVVIVHGQPPQQRKLRNALKNEGLNVSQEPEIEITADK